LLAFYGPLATPIDRAIEIFEALKTFLNQEQRRWTATATGGAPEQRPGGDR